MTIELYFTGVMIGVVAGRCHYHMIEKTEIERLACTLETACDIVVLRTWQKVAGRVVVTHYHTLRVFKQGMLHNFLEIKHTSYGSAACHHHLGGDLIATVEIQDPYLFMG